GNFYSLVLAEIVGRSNVVHLAALQHEMHQALWRRDDTEGNRVMARIAVHEGQADRLAASARSHVDEVADSEAEQVAVKVQASRRVVHADHDMPHPQFARDEAGKRAWRF